ncbi:hypothetical protein C6499_14930 [Candidatus Poribacteria bacterium]|nr:MAG: hypothetical protein C6499_14930 [Candidatus Poribacteria bacterium]
MLKRKVAVICTFILIISLVTVFAHWAPDNGPNIIEGNQLNLTVRHGRGVENPPEVWKKWKLSEEIQDSKGNLALKSEILLSKKIIYFSIPRVEGTAYAYVYCAAQVSTFWTEGEYEVHAKARGWLWWREKRHKNSFTGGVNAQADRPARRRAITGGPNYSGVHLWGKAHIKAGAGNKPIGNLKQQMEWH